MEKTFRITVDGHAYTVTVEELTEDQGNLYPSPNLSHTAAPVAPSAPPPSAPATAPAAGGNDRASPLAGVVISIEVSVGQKVSTGDKVCVIEAMKMKTQVSAHKAGTITAVNIKPGDAVDAGQALMTISD